MIHVYYTCTRYTSKLINRWLLFTVFFFCDLDCNSEARLNYVKILKEYRSRTDVDLSWCLTDDPIESPLDSIFTWFLRSVMIRRRLDDNCLHTLTLLSEVISVVTWRFWLHIIYD